MSQVFLETLALSGDFGAILLGESPGSDLRHLGHRDLEWPLGPGPKPSYHDRTQARKKSTVGRLQLLVVVFISAFSSSAWEIRF